MSDEKAGGAWGVPFRTGNQGTLRLSLSFARAPDPEVRALSFGIGTRTAQLYDNLVWCYSVNSSTCLLGALTGGPSPVVRVSTHEEVEEKRRVNSGREGTRSRGS